MMEIRDAIFSADVKALEKILSANPALASENVSLIDHPAKAPPLHRICDGVFNGNYSEDIALQMAKVFLKYGAIVNVDPSSGKDSPLTAACSLHCDKLALLYIDRGARIDHKGCHGGMALHWSAWCGRDIIIEKLVQMNPEINQLCIDFKSTPLFWAIHGYKFGGKDNRHHQVECARILLKHGADPSIPNFEGYLPIELLDKDDIELLELLRRP